MLARLCRRYMWRAVMDCGYCTELCPCVLPYVQVGAVYMFGFILMCPQLYLNYKLKSVAHLPWR